MSDEARPDAVCIRDPGVRWRVFELECCQKHLGLTVDTEPTRMSVGDIDACGAKYVIWKLHTESTDRAMLDRCVAIANGATHAKHVNDPRNWLACHAKERAFEVWVKNGVPCPAWFEFDGVDDFFVKRSVPYPLLVRLNNSTSGWFSWLVNSDAEAHQRLPELMESFNYRHDGRPNRGVERKFIGVQFIKTTRPENVNMSFRIIVAGDRVVTGYARLGPAADWIAITNRFEPSMGETFIKYQKACQEFCTRNEALIVRAVHALGLNFQGVDVILDQHDKPYFLEVQPGFSVGYAELKSWHPPFYNPSQPEALVAFLKANIDRLRAETPLYAVWLDKYVMFDTAFSALKAHLDKEK